MLDKQFDDIKEENKEPPNKIATSDKEFSIPFRLEENLDRNSQSLRAFEISLYSHQLQEKKLTKQPVNISNLLNKTNQSLSVSKFSQSQKDEMMRSHHSQSAMSNAMKNESYITVIN